MGTYASGTWSMVSTGGDGGIWAAGGRAFPATKVTSALLSNANGSVFTEYWQQAQCSHDSGALRPRSSSAAWHRDADPLTSSAQSSMHGSQPSLIVAETRNTASSALTIRRSMAQIYARACLHPPVNELHSQNSSAPLHPPPSQSPDIRHTSYRSVVLRHNADSSFQTARETWRSL